MYNACWVALKVQPSLLTVASHVVLFTRISHKPFTINYWKPMSLPLYSHTSVHVTLTFDLWPRKPFQQCAYVNIAAKFQWDSFTKYRDTASRINGLRTDGQTHVRQTRRLHRAGGINIRRCFQFIMLSCHWTKCYIKTTLIRRYVQNNKIKVLLKYEIISLFIKYPEQ